jgi:hypothetical protein
MSHVASTRYMILDVPVYAVCVDTAAARRRSVDAADTPTNAATARPRAD